MQIKLSEINDDLGDSRWWNRINMKTFEFIPKVFSLDAVECNEDDVFIHKAILNNERFPTIRYYRILDDGAYIMGGDKIRVHMAEIMVKYVMERQKLPPYCSFVKGFKNGSVQINFTPAKFENFALKVTPKMLNLENEQEDESNNLEGFFKELETEIIEEQELITIENIPSSPLYDRFLTSNKGVVYLCNGKVDAIDKRREFYHEHHTTYYIVSVLDGKISQYETPMEFDPTLDHMNLRLSKTVVDSVSVGDIINVRGILTDSKTNGIVIQNIRKIVKV